MSNMYEIFMPIKDYEDTYAVSNLGRIKNIKTGRILKQRKDKLGYMKITLTKNRQYKTYLVHRLVLSSFKANPENKPCVNHLDENPSNNNLNNLSWCTYKENNNYGSHNERMASTHKANCTYDKLSKPVYCITNNTVYASAHEAARKLNLDNASITKCCQGKFKQTKGYQFKYYTEGDLL